MTSSSPTAEADREAPSTAWGRFAAELRDAVSLRTVGLVAAVLAVQFGFVLSYVGAFHAPAPDRIPVAVVAPAPVAGKTAARLDALPGAPLLVRTAAHEQQARALLLDRTVDAALVIDPDGPDDTLLVASAGGPAVSAAVQQITQAVEDEQQRHLTVSDIRPPTAGDARGMSSFYLVMGWIVGGYLAAAILGMAMGARPANLHRSIVRLGVLALYATASGLGGAVIADPVLGALPGHFTALWALGTLVVFAAAAVTVALQTMLGLLGIGAAVTLFVVLGNPSAGGAYPGPLLPPFWQAIGPWLPPGAATTAVRNTVYFAGHAVGQPLGVLAGYAAAGAAAALTASALHVRRGRRPLPTAA
ncbi:DUF3533 domain-containing protein [Streptomyces sp. ME03-5709C]|nr:DUF3533 domain-containing protein [Streptomyces sp. ME03-5709C]